MIVQYLEISLSVFKIIFQWSVDVLCECGCGMEMDGSDLCMG